MRRRRWSIAAPSAFRPDVSGPGYWVFTPARLADGSIVMVNRGFVPEGRQDPKSRAAGEVTGPVEIVGAMRWPDARHWFTPNDEPRIICGSPATRRRSPPPRGSAPWRRSIVEQEARCRRADCRSPGKLVVNLPDNHLQYALTWYGLAVVLVVVFAVLGVRLAPPRNRRQKGSRLRVPCEAVGFSITVPCIRPWRHGRLSA